MHRLQELVRLHRLGTSSREVARPLKMSRNTERAYRRQLDAVGLLGGAADALPSAEALRAVVGPAQPSPPQPSSVVRWSEKVTTLVEHGAGPQAIYDALRRTEDEFDGSMSAIKRLVRRIKKAKGISAADVAIPVDTAPGEVAQVDFGSVGKLFAPDTGTLRKQYVFVLVLGFSRKMFVRLVFDQKATTWLRLHVEAFAELGAVPRVIVPDCAGSA